MCLAIPGKIVEIKGRKASIEYPGQVREAFVGDEDFRVGDYVLVQMGVAVRKVTKKEAKMMWEGWTS